MNSVLRLAKYFMALLVTVAVSVPFTASADVDVASARIDRIGMIAPNATRGAMVQLTDLSASPKWPGSRQFFLSQAILGKEGLAMVLTAFAMGQPIWVRVAGTAQPLSLVTIVYVNAQ